MAARLMSWCEPYLRMDLRVRRVLQENSDISEMAAITGTFRNGRIELDSAVDWVDGARVAIVPMTSVGEPPESSGNVDDCSWGIAEADYQDTPEYRARLIAQMDSFEPVELTPAEEAEWQAARLWIKEYTIAAVKAQMGL